MRPTTRRRRHGQRRHHQHRQDLVRRHAVAVVTAVTGIGYTMAEVARRLRITPRTLRRWRRPRAQSARLTGRPAMQSSVQERNAVIHYLDQFGPGVGLPPLRAAFPNMSRAELEDLIKRYRRVWRKRHCQPRHVLHWTKPGTVWAMDLAEAPSPIDGIYPYILAVRDLATGQQLLWLPLRDASAPAVAEALVSLFVIHGPPWVLKSDNGSVFGAPAVTSVLRQFAVLGLFSPPHTPSYNGAIEAGIGSLKKRTEVHATRAGHAGHWSWDDVEAARLEANATARPHGLHQPTPDQNWAARTSLVAGDRLSLGQQVEAQRCRVRSEWSLPDDGLLPVMTERAIDRVAIRRALVEHGVLTFSRRLIPPTIPRRKADTLS